MAENPLFKGQGQFAATGNPNPVGSTAWPTFKIGQSSSLALNSAGNTGFVASALKPDHHCALWTRP